jgi:hypothetical protein
MHLPEDAGADLVATPEHLERHAFWLPKHAAVQDEASCHIGENWKLLSPRAKRNDALIARGRKYFQILDSRPAEKLDCLRGNETTVYLLKLVRTMLVEADMTSVVDGKADSRAPPETVLSALYFLDFNHELDTGKAAQLLGHKVGLEAPLRCQLHVLPVTASTKPGPGVGARRIHAIWRSLHDLDSIGPQVGLGFLRDHGEHILPGKAVAHKDDATVVRSCYAAAASRDRAGFKTHHVEFVQGHASSRSVLRVAPVDSGLEGVFKSRAREPAAQHDQLTPAVRRRVPRPPIMSVMSDSNGRRRPLAIASSRHSRDAEST